MENQAHHIQFLLTNELDRCKGKGNSQVNSHIKEIQDIYQNGQQDIEQPRMVNKEKQKEYKTKKYSFTNFITYHQNSADQRHLNQLLFKTK